MHLRCQSLLPSSLSHARIWIHTSFYLPAEIPLANCQSESSAKTYWRTRKLAHWWASNLKVWCQPLLPPLLDKRTCLYFNDTLVPQCIGHLLNPRSSPVPLFTNSPTALKTGATPTIFFESIAPLLASTHNIHTHERHNRIPSLFNLLIDLQWWYSCKLWTILIQTPAREVYDTFFTLESQTKQYISRFRHGCIP